MKRVEDYKDYTHVIHVKNQEEWDNITKLLKRDWTSTRWSHYKENSVIYINHQTYGYLSRKLPDNILPALDFLIEEQTYQIY